MEVQFISIFGFYSSECCLKFYFFELHFFLSLSCAAADGDDDDGNDLQGFLCYLSNLPFFFCRGLYVLFLIIWFFSSFSCAGAADGDDEEESNDL